MTETTQTTELVIAYTRGTKLHAAEIAPDRKLGTTLCGRTGFRHPRFDKPETGPADLILQLSTSACAHCLRKLGG